MNIDREKQGEILVFCGAVLWSMFPVVTVLSFRSVPPLASLALSTVFSAILFAVMLFAKNGWSDIKNKETLKDILFATFFLSVVFYFFLFLGLKYTSAGNVSLIAQMEIVSSFLFFNIWHKEHIPSTHIAGALFVIAGAAIVLYPNFDHFQIGDLLVVIAVFMTPMGNFFQRRARKKVKSEMILFLRCAISAPIILVLSFAFGENLSYAGTKESFISIAINGIFLIGLSKIFWLEGIHIINVAKANAINGIGPLLTLLFAWMLLGTTPTKFQLIAFVPMFFGVILLGMNKRLAFNKTVNKEMEIIHQ